MLIGLQTYMVTVEAHAGVVLRLCHGEHTLCLIRAQMHRAALAAMHSTDWHKAGSSVPT